ncbi:hypothetical protein [Thermococcus sp.]|uniref:hypothetical protein n=1 Tax=Thermococcus sp. TaxID=35749 RepID=UPI00262F75AA|nr:hypothetical protein [Thermococcus sp.]
MRTEVLNASAGAGLLSLVAFFAIIRLLPEWTSTTTVMKIFVIAVLGGIGLSLSVKRELRASGISYLTGVSVALVLIALLQFWNISPSTVLVLVVVSLLPLRFYPPSGLLDALLTGPLYFSGPITVLGLLAPLKVFESVALPLLIVYAGFIGGIAAFIFSVVLLLVGMRTNLK